MKKQDTTAKLAHVEAAMRRWHTRLTRASNTLQKLEKQRRRLLLQQQVGVGRPAKPRAEPPVISTDDPDLVEKVAAALDIDTTIPPELKREAVDVERLKAQRKSKEEADKHKMPLTGRAALDAIRPKRKAKA